MTEPRPWEWELGDEVPHYGKVAAIGFLGGERYYWMSQERGILAVSMIPACAMPTKPAKKRTRRTR